MTTEKKVVTCFVEYKGKILIGRRSSKVGTYQGKWAGISGYIEGDENPKERALKEIEEEIGLSEKYVEMIKEGEILDVPDKEKGILWKVHPYLFKSKTNKIKGD